MKTKLLKLIIAALFSAVFFPINTTFARGSAHGASASQSASSHAGFHFSKPKKAHIPKVKKPAKTPKIHGAPRSGSVTNSLF